MPHIKIITSFLFLFISTLWGYTQDTTNTWKIDSATINTKNIPQWNIDSVRYTPTVHSLARSPQQLRITLSGMGLVSDGDVTPFWLTNNRHGIGSISKNKQYVRLHSLISKNWDALNISGGADVLVSHNLNADFYIHQLYFDFNYQQTTLSVGAKERQSLFKNALLSSGGMTLSNNARPIPQVEFAIPQFININGTNNKLYVMGGIAYGWQTDNGYKKENATNGYYADKILYHRKYGFVKYKPNTTWNFILGLEMDAQWGGHFYKKGKYEYKSSAKLRDFFKVLIPTSGGSSANITDRVNIVGNVYGSSHFIAEYKKQNYTIKAYHEHFFEDHSGLFFKNIPDGLYGIELNLPKKNWISDIVFEYLHSKNQSGPFLWDKNDEIPVQVSGGDNYYNHIDYISLTNYGYAIGNPLFTSAIYNRGSSLTIYNSRLSAFHIGIGGSVNQKISYRTLVSYNKSWGTPLIPSIKIRDQFSAMCEATYNGNNKTKSWLISCAIGYDKSQMVGDNIGIQLKIAKTLDMSIK
ncbi:MAG: hypothetical protein RL662_1099 [Bacteroidota bacterium]|jgi:hypothetical protein